MENKREEELATFRQFFVNILCDERYHAADILLAKIQTYTNVQPK